MAATIGFRPNTSNQDDFEAIRKWCKANGSSFSTVINSLIPAIRYTLENRIIERRDGTFMRCDFGDVLLLPQWSGPGTNKTEFEYFE